jgi:hypothetical protein
MRIVCWMTHTYYVILIAFLPQQWLQVRASMLRHTYFACLAYGVLWLWSLARATHAWHGLSSRTAISEHVLDKQKCN